MPGGQYVALSGMRTRMDDLDRLAEDIANAGTAGYKAERSSRLAADRPNFDDSLQTAIDVTHGDKRMDMRTGAIIPTGRDLDVAIEGSGFFTIQGPSGTQYTRDGHFVRAADGTLTTNDGSPVLGTDDDVIKIGTGKITIQADGTVRSGNMTAGQLKITEFDDPGKLTRQSGSLLGAGTQTPNEASDPSVHAGAIEESNVKVVERIAELTDASRGFEALQRGVSILMNDVYGKAIEQLGRR